LDRLQKPGQKNGVGTQMTVHTSLSVPNLHPGELRWHPE